MPVGKPVTETGRSRWAVVLTLGALSLALILSGVVKPIFWDEEVYFQFAEHIARNPLDPYGAAIRLAGQLFDGIYVLAPPVLLYWWAAAIALLGNNVHLTALFLLPFAVAYTVSFHSLARRFARGLELPLTIVASTSGWALVTFSYMLDFPAVALGLSALALFVAGVDTDRRKLVLAAGIVAGLALETKYNSALCLAAFALYGVLSRRPRYAVCAIVLAIAVFIAVEIAIVLRHGHSHFLLQLSGRSDSTALIREIARLRGLAYGLIANTGPSAIGVLFIAAVALGASRRALLLMACIVIVAFGLGAIGLDNILGHVLPWITPARMPTLLTMSGLLGLLLLIQWLRLAGRWLGSGAAAWDRDNLFLLFWAIAAVLVYLAMSPFPAGRRMGDVVAATMLMFGRAAAQGPARETTAPIWRAAAVNAACGCVMLAIALVDADNAEKTVRSTEIAMRDGEKPFERWQLVSLAMERHFAATDARPVDVGRSALKPGDLLATDLVANCENPEFRADGLEQAAIVRGGVNLGVSVLTSYYRFQLPWISRSETRPCVTIFRATRPTTIMPK